MLKDNIFIATLPRSGSTLLGLMLGAHSKICHIGESAYWEKLDTSITQCCCGVVGCQTLTKIAKLLSKYPAERKGILTACSMIDVLEEPHKIRHPLSLSTHTDNTDPSSLIKSLQQCYNGLNIICDIARKVTNKKIVVENSKYLRIGDFLLRNSKGKWKIIIMVRDPRGVALSSKLAGERKNVSRPIEDKIPLLLSFAKRTYSLMQKQDVLLIRYEDLCNNPICTLKVACDFINVKFEIEMLKFKDYKGHLLMGNHMMHDNQQAVQEDIRWHSMLNAAEKSLFRGKEVISAYKHLGYDLNSNV